MQDSLRLLKPEDLASIDSLMSSQPIPIDGTASIIGLIISVIGFALTLAALRKAKSAAEAASESIQLVRRDAARIQAVSNISAVLPALEEIKRLHRKKAWDQLPDRYSSLKRSLIFIRESMSDLTESQTNILTESIQQFSGIETKVEKSLHDGKQPTSSHKMTLIISAQTEKLQTLLAQIQALSPISK